MVASVSASCTPLARVRAGDARTRGLLALRSVIESGWPANRLVAAGIRMHVHAKWPHDTPIRGAAQCRESGVTSMRASRKLAVPGVTSADLSRTQAFTAGDNESDRSRRRRHRQ